MPTKMGTCCKGKGVLVTVYVEKPKWRTFSNHHNHQQHHRHNHHHVRHTIMREVVHFRRGAGGGGYISRRAELLQYSQHLRQSAARSTPAASTPSIPRTNATSNQQSLAQIVAVQRKPKKNSKAPTCFGNWKIPNIFGFLINSQAKERKTRKKRSSSTSANIKAAIKSFKVQKQQGFLSKLFSAVPKRK